MIPTFEMRSRLNDILKRYDNAIMLTEKSMLYREYITDIEKMKSDGYTTINHTDEIFSMEEDIRDHMRRLDGLS